MAQYTAEEKREIVDSIIFCKNNNRKMDAIKLVRDVIPGLGLREALNYVDQPNLRTALEADLAVTLKKRLQDLHKKLRDNIRELEVLLADLPD